MFRNSNVVKLENTINLESFFVGHAEEVITEAELGILELSWLAERSMRIKRLKAEIAQGNYRVNSRLLARSILTRK